MYLLVGLENSRFSLLDFSEIDGIDILKFKFSYEF